MPAGLSPIGRAVMAGSSMAMTRFSTFGGPQFMCWLLEVAVLNKLITCGKACRSATFTESYPYTQQSKTYIMKLSYYNSACSEIFKTFFCIFIVMDIKKIHSLHQNITILQTTSQNKDLLYRNVKLLEVLSEVSFFTQYSNCFRWPWTQCRAQKRIGRD